VIVGFVLGTLCAGFAAASFSSRSYSNPAGTITYRYFQNWSMKAPEEYWIIDGVKRPAKDVTVKWVSASVPLENRKTSMVGETIYARKAVLTVLTTGTGPRPDVRETTTWLICSEAAGI
jgi:hypothetical protein